MENTAYGTQAIKKYIYLVCDTYKEGSVKTGERRARATGKKHILKSPDMKLHFDFCSFHESVSFPGDNIMKYVVYVVGNLDPLKRF